MAVLSHVMLLLASLFTAPVHGSVDTGVCEPMPHGVHVEREWQPAPQEIRVRTYGLVRTRGVASVRVLGRCVVKAAPKNAQPVLFGSFTAQIDDRDDENLASTRAEARAPYPRPAAVGAGPTAMYVQRTPLTQLERPPRV